MSDRPASVLLDDYLDQPVVIDLTSPYVCIGTLHRADAAFFDLRDADLHDLRDGRSTREIYVFDSARLGIRRNRARVLIRRDEVVALTRLADIAED
jgi:small nuclear ribonucleoprotein (snRNP)-like protein